MQEELLDALRASGTLQPDAASPVLATIVESG
jgi:hypothetical protein